MLPDLIEKKELHQKGVVMDIFLNVSPLKNVFIKIILVLKNKFLR